jgi:hypothetical protein
MRNKKAVHLLSNFDQTEAAKYFHSLSPNSSVHNKDIWYVLQAACYWAKSDKTVGSTNKVNDVLKDELPKLTNYYLGKLSIIKDALSREDTETDGVRKLKKKRSYRDKAVDK